MLTEKKKRRERICRACPVDWISFRQLLEFIDFRHEERRVLARSRIYHVLPFPLPVLHRCTARTRSTEKRSIETRDRPSIQSLNRKFERETKLLLLQTPSEAIFRYRWVKVCSNYLLDLKKKSALYKMYFWCYLYSFRNTGLENQHI